MESSIHEKGGQWYYWDETGADTIGPFTSPMEAELSLRRYVEALNTPTQVKSELVSDLALALGCRLNQARLKVYLRDKLGCDYPAAKKAVDRFLESGDMRTRIHELIESVEAFLPKKLREVPDGKESNKPSAAG